MEVGLVLFVFDNSVVQVACVREIHHDAQTARQIVEKCFFVADHVRVLDGSENAHFVKGVGLFLLGKPLNFDLIELV